MPSTAFDGKLAPAARSPRLAKAHSVLAVFWALPSLALPFTCSARLDRNLLPEGRAGVVVLEGLQMARRSGEGNGDCNCLQRPLCAGSRRGLVALSQKAANTSPCRRCSVPQPQSGNRAPQVRLQPTWVVVELCQGPQGVGQVASGELGAALDCSAH